jgi:hypothetical protein
MYKVLRDDKFGGLGFYAQCTNNVAQGLVSLGAAKIIEKLGGIKNAIILGAFMHTLYTAAMILPAWEHHNNESQEWLHKLTYGVIMLAGA